MKTLRWTASVMILLMMLTVNASSAAPEVRLKDIADLAGVRDNQLIGYGIVVGLAGTGDSNKSVFTVKSVITALERLGVDVREANIDLPNIAAVIVTANLPPYASEGSRLDIQVASIGDASSLRGGLLLQTPLKAANGEIYAVAQGNLSLSGVGIGSQRGAGGGGQNGTFSTVGRVEGGALIERSIVSEFAQDGYMTYLLRKPDFTTAARVASAINNVYSPDIARAENAERIRVIIPAQYVNRPVDFVARLEEITLRPDAEAKVVINERTGTIVFGENVTVSAVAISHGSLSLSVQASSEAAAAQLMDVGEAIQGEQQALRAASAGQERTEMAVALPEGANVRDVVRALNAVGARPADIIAILQAICDAGALHAELELM